MCYPIGMSALDTYAPDRIGYRYGVPDSAYSKGYHRGQDVRKLNENGTASVVTDVEAVDDGTVVYVGRPNSLLAWTVVLDTGRKEGRYESHSHLADISVSVGQAVKSGDRLARNAKMTEDHGFIDGVHDHITITDAPTGAWATYQPEYDPLPYIQAAHARAAEASQENDMSDSIIVSCTAPGRNGIWLMSPGHIHQFTGEEWGYVQSSGSVAGIRIVDCGDNARAFDLNRNIFQPQASALTAADVKAVVEGAIKDGVKVSADVDYARVAKAVNEDAAKRLAQ